MLNDSLATLIRELKKLCDQQDWDKLSALDARINSEINLALQSAQTDNEKQQLVAVLKRLDIIYSLLIKDSKKYRDEVTQELRKLTKDKKAVNKYLDSSGFIT